MPSPRKKNLEPGYHWLRVVHWYQQNRRLVVSHQPLESGFRQVHRTFGWGSEALADYTRNLLGEAISDPNHHELDRMKGKEIRVEIGAAANPKFVNLVRVLEVAQGSPISMGEEPGSQGSLPIEGGQND